MPSLELHLVRTPAIDAALTELIQLITARFPAATFEVAIREDPLGYYLLTYHDEQHPGPCVMDLVGDRLFDFQVEDKLPVYVLTRQPQFKEANGAARTSAKARPVGPQELHLVRTPAIDAALAELEQMIATAFPGTTFEVRIEDRPVGYYLVAYLADWDDALPLLEVVGDRVVDLQVDDKLPVYVQPAIRREHDPAVVTPDLVTIEEQSLAAS